MIIKRLKNLRGTVLCSTSKTKCFRSYHQPQFCHNLYSTHKVYQLHPCGMVHPDILFSFFFNMHLRLKVGSVSYSKHELMNSAINMFCSAAWYQYKSGTVQSSSAENFSTIKCQQLVYAFFVTFEIAKPTLNSLQQSKVRKAIYTCSVFVNRKVIAVTQEKATHKKCLRAVK